MIVKGATGHRTSDIDFVTLLAFQQISHNQTVLILKLCPTISEFYIGKYNFHQYIMCKAVLYGVTGVMCVCGGRGWGCRSVECVVRNHRLQQLNYQRMELL